MDRHSKDNDKLDYGPDYQNQAIKILHNMLEKGLMNRVHRICALPNKVMEWEITENSPDNIRKLFIGLELNPEFCYNIVDKGPEANLPEVSKLSKNGIKVYSFLKEQLSYFRLLNLETSGVNIQTYDDFKMDLFEKLHSGRKVKQYHKGDSYVRR